MNTTDYSFIVAKIKADSPSPAQATALRRMLGGEKHADRALNIREVSEMTGYSDRQIRRLVAEGRIRAILSSGGKRASRYAESSVIALIGGAK